MNFPLAMRKTTVSGRGNQDFDFEHVKSEMPVKHLREMIEEHINVWFWSSCEGSRLEIQMWVLSAYKYT